MEWGYTFVIRCTRSIYVSVTGFWSDTSGKRISPELVQCIRYLLKKNILCGDALTMLQQDGQPITFCEWTFIGTGGKVKRRDFELSELLKNVEYDKPKAGEEGLLFADTGEPTFVHLPKREYPVTEYLKLPDYE